MTIAESWHDLEADLLGPEPDYDEAPPVEIDRATADRYLRRIAKLDAQHQADREVADAQIEQVQAWRGARAATYMEQRAWLQGVLRRFHEALLAIDPKIKTVKLPAGELHMRGQQPSWTFTEADTFLAWAHVHLPVAVRPAPPTFPSIDVNAAKRALTKEITNERGKVVDKVLGVVPDTMERPPGLKVEDVPDKFSVEFGDQEQDAIDARMEIAADQANAMADERDAQLDRVEDEADDRAAATADARDYIESVAGEPF